MRSTFTVLAICHNVLASSATVIQPTRACSPLPHTHAVRTQAHTCTRVMARPDSLMDPREAKHVAVLLRKAALTEKRAQTFGYVRSGTISVARPCWMLRRGTVSVPCPHAGKSRVEAPLPGVPGVSGGSFSSLTFLGSRVTHEERFAELAEHGAWGAGRGGCGVVLRRPTYGAYM